MTPPPMEYGHMIDLRPPPAPSRGMVSLGRIQGWTPIAPEWFRMYCPHGYEYIKGSWLPYFIAPRGVDETLRQ